MQRLTKKRKGPGRPVGGTALTAAVVAEVAAKLIDSDGIANFSMRRLGQKLGVEAMALYNHFESKEAILDAVASLVFASIQVPSSKGIWRSRLKKIGHSMRSLAREHPNLFRLAMTRKVIPRAGLPVTEAVLTAFSDQGLSPQDQAVAYHNLFLFIRGFCLWEIEERELMRERLAEAAPIYNNYPRTFDARQRILGANMKRLFETSFEAVIRGLVARSGRTVIENRRDTHLSYVP